MTRLGLLTVVVVLALAGCSESAADREQNAARPACEHYRNVAKDVSDGVLTDFEARSKFQEVESRAPDGSLRDLARDLVAAWTTGDFMDREEAIRMMNIGCSIHGH